MCFRDRCAILIKIEKGVADLQSDALEQLQDRCLACTNCPLAATRTQVVFGVGNISAPIMFVGEGPGEQEDLQGEPFVGPAGKLLDAYLKVIDLDRDSCYIANIVKCRPPHNRDPRPEEQEACIGWLREQVRIMRPKIIVCLGRIAAQKLMDPSFRVTRQHGQFINKKGTLMMGTFHPSALLRNPENRPAALSDFIALREQLQRLEVDAE